MKNAKKVLALLLALSMVMSYLPMPALAEEASCPHHFHDKQCGYVEKVEGSPCGHVVCSETCLTKQVVECIHDHEEAGCVYTPAVEPADCDHVHGDCNYVAPQDEVVCICDPQTVHGEDCASVLTEGAECSCVPNVVHAEGCVPQPAVEEYCGHTHGNCAFREAADEKWSCGHVCSEASGCIRMECAHVCPGDNCGYVAAVEGSDCTYVCEVCNPPVDEAVEAVKSAVSALPEVSAAYAMSNEELGGWNNAIQSAYEAYDKLTADQKAKLTPEGEKLIGLLQALSDPARTAPATENSGECGDAAIWTLSDGTLTVSGSGTMKDYEDRSEVGEIAPWRANSDQITAVVVQNGITAIGNFAFHELNNVISVSLPDTVTTAGNGAFSKMTALTGITLPGNLQTISAAMFSWCSSLKSIEIPSGVTAIGKAAFSNCLNLETITIPTSVQSIGDSAFSFSQNLKDVYYGGDAAGWADIEIASGNTNLTDAIIHYAVGCGNNHNFGTDGKCDDCGEYQPAVENQDEYYEIGNPGQLFWFAAQQNKNQYMNAILTADITVPEGDAWNWTRIRNYSKKFDGNDKTISGLRCSNGGMFGTLSNGAEVLDLTIKNSAFTASDGHVGAIANEIDGSVTVSGCTVENTTVSGVDKVGGIVGQTSGGNIDSGRDISIANCTVSGNSTITSTESQAGGILGGSVNGRVTISGCCVTASGGISGPKAGGIIGYVSTSPAPYDRWSASVTKCAVNTTVSGTDAAGGIGGYLSVPGNLYISDSSAVGSVSSTSGTASGFIGNTADHDSSRCGISNSYSVVTLSGSSVSNIGYGRGVTVTNSYRNTGNAYNSYYKTDAQFASGEVTWLLNKSVTDGSQTWYQTVNEGYPAFTGETVYYGYLNCMDLGYANAPVSRETPGKHTWEYDLSDEDTITAKCSKCQATSSVKLLPPETLVSDGVTARTARLDGSIPGEETPAIRYAAEDGSSLTGGGPVEAGTYTASITLGEETATISFTITGVVAEVTAGGTTTPYGTLAAAIAAASASEGSTLKLLQDIDLTATQEINSGNFTLDLNDKKLHAQYRNVLYVTGCELVITDSGTDPEKGSITSNGSMCRGVDIKNAKVTISGISIDVSNQQASYGVYVDGGELILSDCSVRAGGSTFPTGINVKAGKLTVSDSSITGSNWGINFSGSEAEISNSSISGGDVGVYAGGGTLTFSDSNIAGQTGMIISGDSTVVNITNCTVSGVGNAYYGGYGCGVSVISGTVNIFGGTVSGNAAETDGTGYGMKVFDGTANITGGSISGENADIYKEQGKDGTVLLGIPAGGEEGASFPGGIQVENTTLKDILGDNASYWIGTEEQPLEADTREIAGDVIVKKHTQHSFVSFDEEKVTSETHTGICGFCGKAVEEAHSFTKEIVDEDYLQSAADHSAAAVYYRSCECGAKGTETFSHGDPIAHTFDKEVAEEKYLQSAATHSAAAVYYKSCECGEKGTETFISGDPIAHTFDKEVAEEKYLKSAATHSAAAVYYKSCECGAKGTETFSYGKPIAHTFNKQIVGEAYLKSAATHSAAAVYYKSCECGAKGTETFSHGNPIAHTFNKQIAGEAYLQSAATHGAAAVYYKSCECGAKGTETFSYGTPIVENTVILPSEEFQNTTAVWIDGVSHAVKKENNVCYVEVPGDTETILMATYTFHVGDANDVHTQYPTGMKVWQLKKQANGSYSATHLQELDNILQYSGSSIRITGNKGIRMITSVEANKKSALTGAGLAGYKLVEYGTVLAQSSKMDGPLVLGKSYARSNYAYKRGVADPVFAYSGNLVQYTNVLVGFNMDQCKEDIAMRPYMILEDAAGKQETIYGGIVYRSIGYIAYQNRGVFGPGSAAYNYVWEIIHHVYGNKYDADYKG